MKEKELAEPLDQLRRKRRNQVIRWRRKNPEQAKQHFRNYYIKKFGPNYRPRKRGAYFGAFDKNFEETNKKSGGS